MNITNVKYVKCQYSDKNENVGLQCTIDGVVCSVPMDENNTDYAEILKQVKEGTLTIQDAD